MPKILRWKALATQHNTHTINLLLHVVKIFQESIAETSFILELVKRMEDNNPMNNLAKSVPGSLCLRTRDGLDLHKTKDLLFLAVLVERSRPSGWVKRVTAEQGWEFLPAVAPEGSQTKGAPPYYSTKSLRKRLNTGTNLWQFRRLCESPSPPDVGMSIEGKTLYAKGKWTLQNADAPLSQLKHPLNREEVPHKNSGLAQLRFFEWCDLGMETPCDLPSANRMELLDKIPPFKIFKTPAATPEKAAWRENAKREHERKHLSMLLRDQEKDPRFLQLICPLCGPCVPLNACISSSASTWQNMCGRSWSYQLCPGCLAVLGSRLVAMN